ncbi:NB-ARC domain-containing protein [Lentzea fradiae]|uniref:NB-ARC domain-containing protein n=1 Tax=Lentzea fradiae TaxID=200378 RepID=A0A1G7P884_9PSEU|nr:AAA family ATPase [Lentzea fradiae]SDF81809.1 NB-ARC domain-containing protein [Lentzea fradiae]
MSVGAPSERGTTSNHVDSAGAAVQAGEIRDVHFHGVPDSGSRPGLVSTIAPMDLLPGKVFGRERVVDDLVETARRADGSQIVLHGTGGSGKTAVALALADRLGRELPCTRVWWVDGSSENNLSAGLREVVYDADPHHRIDEVVRAWRGEGSAPNLLKRALAAVPGAWVLIIDGADDRRLLEQWTAALQHTAGTVVVTTRDGKPGRWGRARTHEVSSLHEEAAAEMLQALAPSCGTADQARELARTLGYLPLALRLAGSYLNSVLSLPTKAGLALPDTFDQYRVVFHERFRELDRMHEIGSVLAERQLLSRTWELSLDLLADLGMPWARLLLRWLSCFEQAPIPCDIANAEILTQSSLFHGITGMDLIHAFVCLTNFGLVEQVSVRDMRSSSVTTKCWALHPVIREANRHQPDVRRDLHGYLSLCYATLDGYTSFLSAALPEDLSTWAVLSPHCEFVVEWIHRDRSRLSSPENWELLGTKLSCAAARFAALSGQHERAEAIFRHALVVRVRYLGENHPEVFAVRRDIVLLRWRRRRSELALAEIVLLTEDARAALSEHDPFTIACHLDLALAQAELAEADDADRVVDDYRTIVRLSRELHGRTETTALSAQMNLVTELGRREDESCVTELLRLLVMIAEVEKAPDVVAQVPFRLAGLRTAVMSLLQNARGWCDPPD